ncbi:MAG: 2-oxoacid:acceptor oxidoreductase subunit alpha [Candidatus Geothermincolia bacterium]
MDYTIKIGGAAGQGLQTIGASLSKVFTRYGYHLFAFQDYESRVRGGHNFYQIRFSERQVWCPRVPVDILIALDKETIPLHQGELAEGGFAIYDASDIKERYEGDRFIDVPFTDIAVKHGGNKVMSNTAASGAVLGMLGMKSSLLEDVIEHAFAGKKDLVEPNKKVARAGYEYGRANCPRCSFQPAPRATPRMSIEGNQAVALAAIASGCKFYAGYPMTPTTGILTFMAMHAERHGIVVEQAEDEIAAINMVLGASYAGVRSMTSTSGGGFALMVEGLSLAGMTETPAVVVLGQRPGPATGLPTRTEQADLLFGLFAGHGDVPRVGFAPGTPEQAFSLVNKAFDLTEKYQVPAIIFTDQHYADSEWSLERIDLAGFEYNDYRLRGDAFRALSEYRRHALTASGVSPMAVPGDAPLVVVTDSDEHDEAGHLIEDADTRRRMVEKRYHSKLVDIRREIEPPVLYGSDKPDLLLVGWGSNYGVMKEAVDHLSADREAGMLHFSELYPFPEEARRGYLDLIKGAKMTICLENNASGRFAQLLRMETGYEFERSINKYDGRPFNLEELLEEIDGHTSGLQRSKAGVVPGLR